MAPGARGIGPLVVDDGGDVDVLVRVDPADDDDGHGCFSVHALGPPPPDSKWLAISTHRSPRQRTRQ